jgi:hypothetical protein
VDLVTKSAGGKGFSTYIYPTTLYYALRGDIKVGVNGYLWLGTNEVANGIHPDPTTAASYRIQQPAILTGLVGSFVTGPGNTYSVTLTVRKTTAAGVGPTDTVFSITFTGADKTKSFYNGSVDFAAGDFLHVYLTYTGGNANTAHDLSLQVDMF